MDGTKPVVFVVVVGFEEEDVEHDIKYKIHYYYPHTKLYKISAFLY
jgi:hypothetical protein